MFNKASKTDKFATLYTYLDGNLDYQYVRYRCLYKGLTSYQTDLIYGFLRGDKISYMAKIRNYSERMLIYKLDEAIDKLVK